MKESLSFQRIINELQQFWIGQNCVVIPPCHSEISTILLHPLIFFQAIQPAHCSSVCIQTLHEPQQNRQGKHPTRTQQQHTVQVTFTASPENIQEAILTSLSTLGITGLTQDLQLHHSSVHSTVLNTHANGWQAWLNGTLIIEYRHYQQINQHPCQLSSIHYHVEPLAIAVQSVESVYDLCWSHDKGDPVYYRDLFLEHEIDMYSYHRNNTRPEDIVTLFECYINQATILIKENKIKSSFSLLTKAIHAYETMVSNNHTSITAPQCLAPIHRLLADIAESYNKKTQPTVSSHSHPI